MSKTLITLEQPDEVRGSPTVVNAVPPIAASPAQSALTVTAYTPTITVTNIGTEFNYYMSPSGNNGNSGLTESTPWATFAYALGQVNAGDKLGVMDGSYSEAIGTVPAAVTVQAVNDGAVTLTGAFNPGGASGHVVQGMKVVSSVAKYLGANGIYRRMSFVGGPAMSGAGAVNTLCNGNNISVYESAFYGSGGRYLLMSYQSDNNYFEDIIFRPDGGCTYDGSNPAAAMNMYDAEGCEVVRGILIDGIYDASIVVLGGLGMNTHTTTPNCGKYTQCVSLNTVQGYFWGDGSGILNGAEFEDCIETGDTPYGACIAWQPSNGGACSVTRMLSDDRCYVYGGSLVHTNSLIASGGTGCTGVINGDGANLTLNTDFLNDPRWATEMNTAPGRGWYDSGLSLGAYVQAGIDAI